MRIEGISCCLDLLHARTVSARRCRQEVADLNEVKTLKDNLRIPAISNGNVRVFTNFGFTRADGLMVREPTVCAYSSYTCILIVIEFT